MGQELSAPSRGSLWPTRGCGAVQELPARLLPLDLHPLCCSAAAQGPPKLCPMGNPTPACTGTRCGGPSYPESGQQITWEDIQVVRGHQAVWADVALSGQVPSFLKAHEGSEKANTHQNQANYISWKSHLQEQQMTFWDRQMGTASAGDKFPKRMITQPSKMALL